MVVNPFGKVHILFPLVNEHRRFSALLSVSIFLILFARITVAQDNTLYLMPDIPQANQLNPAIMKLCRIYIELPVISSVRINFRNTAFSYHDALREGTGAQSGKYIIDLSNLENKLKGINYFQAETDINLLGAGFGYKGWYFTFGIANHSDMLMSYPHDIILLRDANLQIINGLSKPINLNRLGGESTVWNSIGVSAAREIKKGLKVGLRVKYLQGMANIISRRSQFAFTSAINPVSLETNINSSLNASFPVEIQNNPSGLVNKLNFSNSFNNFVSDFIFNGNRGAAIDAGFVYDPNEETEFSASIIDLGFIHWKKNTNNFTSIGDYLYNATQLYQFYSRPNQGDLIKALKDSTFRAVTASGPSTYTTLIPVKIFGGVTRAILPKLRAGAMTRIEIYNKHILPSMSLSMNYTPIPAVAASLSYTLMNNKFNQIGAGIALGNHIAQFYMITDNIPLWFKTDSKTGLFWPYYAHMFSLRLGINLMFGCKNSDDKKHQPNRRDNSTCPAYW